MECDLGRYQSTQDTPSISQVAPSLFPLLQPREQFDHLTSPLSIHLFFLQPITLIRAKLSLATSEHILKFLNL